MSRTLKLADILAAVGAVAVLVSSFLDHEAHGSYIGWHELLVNQLVVTDILGFVAGTVAILASLDLLPRRVPWRALTAAASVVVLINSIVSTLSFSQFLSQASALVHIASPGVGYAFYLAIAGGVVLVAGCSLRFVPVMVRPLAGGNKALTAAPGYQAQGAYPGYAHQGVAPTAPGGYQPPTTGYGAAPGAYVPGPQSGYQHQAPTGYGTPGPAGYGTPAPAGYGTPAPTGYADPATTAPGAAQAGPAQPPGQFASPYQPSPQPPGTPDAGGPPSGAWPAQSWPPPASQSQAASPAPPEPSAAEAAPAESREPAPVAPGWSQAEAAPSPAPAWARPDPAPAPAPAPQPFSPFWAAVPTPRPVYQPDNSAGLAGTLHPGTWYAVVGTHPGGLLVQLPSGINAVLVDTTDLIRA